MATKKDIEALENALATQDAFTRQSLKDLGLDPDAKDKHEAVGVFDCDSAQAANLARAELTKLPGVKAWGRDTQVITGPESKRPEIDRLAKKMGWPIQWLKALPKG